MIHFYLAPIGHIQHVNILTGKICEFFLTFSRLSIPKRDLDTKKILPNIEICPESLEAMLEYWHIERGLFARGKNAEKDPSTRGNADGDNRTIYIRTIS